MTLEPAPRAFDATLELLRRAQSGDRGALQTVFDRYSPRLLETIRLMMGDEARRSADSVDFLQGVFLEVIRDLERLELRSERSFLLWLTSIARNNIRDQVRRRRERALESLLASQGPCPEPSGGSTSPASHAAAREDLQGLVDALLELREDDRRVIELRDLEGLRFRDVALRLGRSEEAAQALHTRALVRLGRSLRKGPGR